MWTDIVGGLFVLTGLGMAINPEKMRKKLKRHSLKAVRRLFAGLALTAGALLISAGWQETGWTQKGLTAAGIIAIVKSVFFIRSKSGDLISTRVQDVPGIVLRIVAICQIALGAWMVLLEPKDSSQETTPPTIEQKDITEES